MKLPIIFTLFSFALSVSAQAQNLYRYTNSEGVTVIATKLPSGYVDSGYEVIDKHGRVLKVFAPRFSDEKKAALKAEESKLRQIEARRKRDTELLQLYSSTDEARNEVERRVAEIHVQIELLEGAMVRAQKSLDKKNDRVAKIKAAGRKVGEQLIAEISADEESLSKTNREKEKLEKDIRQTRETADADIERLEILLKRQQTTADEKQISNLSTAILQGDWRNREDFWLDWGLDENGNALIRSQTLGTSQRSESLGTWELKGNQIVFLINQRKTTDARGTVKEQRVSEEQRATVLEANKRKMLIVFNGSLMTLTRP